MTDLGFQSVSFLVHRFADEVFDQTLDTLAVEEPLEIRLGYDLPDGSRAKKTVCITMRTPGHDFDLAAGFLYTEGIIQSADDIRDIKHCGTILSQAKSKNIVIVELMPGLKMDLSRLANLERHFYTSSSCGVCGKTSIEALKIQNPHTCKKKEGLFTVSSEWIHGLPEKLRKLQGVFENTGGLHASGLFAKEGDATIIVREDVGRHNALDKVIGHCLLSQMLPLSSFVLLLSGRASFELVQKAAMAGIEIMAAVGAPSSLAVELASEVDLTLLGFVRNRRFNIYHGEHRILKQG